MRTFVTVATLVTSNGKPVIETCASTVRVALVHDWLITWRGGEKVLEALAELLPQADLFTLFHEPGAMPPSLERRAIHTAFVDRVPGLRRRHREALPLLPFAVRTLNLEGYELVVSSSHCVAKAAPVEAGARHLSYVHAPLRYMWDRFDDYFGKGRAAWPVRTAARALRPLFQAWDVKTAAGVDAFVANSEHVARQVAARYGRAASVVYPPVELERFTSLPLQSTGQGGYFLCIGALAPYKRIDIAIEAFRHLPYELWVGGGGQHQSALQAGLPSNVKWLGPVPDEQLPELMRGARALIFPGEEDFGITPLEVQACGRPVIAYGRGGALETVTPQTGRWFYPQTPAALEAAVRSFVDGWEQQFDPAAARAHAQRFSRQAFMNGMRAQLLRLAPELDIV